MRVVAGGIGHGVFLATIPDCMATRLRAFGVRIICRDSAECCRASASSNLRRMTMPSISGIAHVQLTVTSMERSVPFYETLLHSLEMVTLMKTPDFFYCIGGKTGVAISPATLEHVATAFEQGRPGLHHLCFRAKSREDVDAIHQVALSLGARIVRAPRQDNWAPGYYSVLFEDPDGIRIEANFVPGRGLLRDGAEAG